MFAFKILSLSLLQSAKVIKVQVRISLGVGSDLQMFQVLKFSQITILYFSLVH